MSTWHGLQSGTEFRNQLNLFLAHFPFYQGKRYASGTAWQCVPLCLLQLLNQLTLFREIWYEHQFSSGHLSGVLLNSLYFLVTTCRTHELVR